ncbi:putative Fe-containing alcohol dehydrogenase [Coniochaeta sp. 2T2.1]|nr:putative Fe-containing alcohol dehydrogenase [Coniochaeta sp. 2T2.1]
MSSPQETLIPLSPTRPYPLITLGLPFDAAIARHLSTTLSSTRPFILVSRSLAANTPALSVLTDTLTSSGFTIAGVRRGMAPHTLYRDVLSVAREVSDSSADSIVVVGGGSLVDGAKAVAFALANGADDHDKPHALLKTSNDVRHKKVDPTTVPAQKPGSIPLIIASTTLSAGEFNIFGAGATDERTKHKQLFSDPGTPDYLRVIALDPELTLTTPERVWLSTGLRAVDHCVESVCSSKPNEGGTEAALRGLGRLVPSLLKTKRAGTDKGARLDSMLGAMESMRPFVVHGVPVGASHGIGHQIGPFGVPHAETNCIALPAVQKFNARANADRQAIVLDALWAQDEVAEVLTRHDLVKGEADLGDVLDVIIRELGFPRTLKEYGIGRDKLDAIAESALRDALCQLNVVQLTRREQVLEILEMCVGDQ